MPKSGSDALFQLIRSMRKHEKRYFKVHARNRAGRDDLSYVDLFDAIDSQKTYDEAGVFKALKPTGKKRFSKTKAYLQDQVLQSLSAYEGDSSVNSKIRTLLRQAEIFYHRMIYRQCAKTLDKAYALCRHYELDPLLLEVLHWQYCLVLRGYQVHELARILSREKEALERITNFYEYRDLSSRVFSRHLIKGTERGKEELKKLDEVLRHSLLRDEKKALSLRAKLYFCDAHFLYYMMRGEHGKSHIYSKKSVELYLAQPHHISWHPEFYLTRLNNLLISCLGLGKYNEMKFYLEKLQDASKHLKSGSNRTLAFFYRYHELNYSMNIGDFKEGARVSDEVAEHMKQHEKNLEGVQKTLLWMNMSINHFGNGEYSKVIHWLNKIRYEPQLKVRKDLESFVKIFYLLVHYEMGNKELASYLQQNVRYYLKRHSQLFVFEKQMLDFFRNILKISSRKAQAEEFKKLRKEILAIARDPHQRIVLEIFDYQSWVESKIENRTFAELVKRKAL